MNNFTNLDALWLDQLADYHGGTDPNTANRLRLIAQHIQSLDERNQVLSNNQTYQSGYAAAMRELRARSNVEPQSVDDGQTTIFDQIDKLAKAGKVKRVPFGTRALDDKPHEFNAPIRKKREEAAKPSGLDLSFLGDL